MSARCRRGERLLALAAWLFAAAACTFAPPTFEPTRDHPASPWADEAPRVGVSVTLRILPTGATR